VSIISSCPFSVGQAIEFDYPSQNEVGIAMTRKHRRVVIQSIRDVANVPLHSESYERRPYTRRARFLVVGRDLDKQDCRSFYLDSMTNITPIEGTLVRIGLYDPIIPWFPVLYLDDIYTNSPGDRQKLHQRLQQERDDALSSSNQWNVGVFPCRQ
jgi:hypothetical protein